MPLAMAEGGDHEFVELHLDECHSLEDMDDLEGEPACKKNEVSLEYGNFQLIKAQEAKDRSRASMLSVIRVKVKKKKKKRVREEAVVKRV